MLNRLFSRKKTVVRRSPKVLETAPAVDPPICPNCNIRPVAAKPTAGEFFDFCSKGCATNVKKGNLNSLCEYCKQRPKFKDGTRVHPYCGRRCARSAAADSANLPPNPPNLADSLSVLSQTVASSLFCQDPDCVLPAFMDTNGTQSNYCVLHKKQVSFLPTSVQMNDQSVSRFREQGCISCRAAPSTDKSVLCQPCHDDALSRAPALVRVPEDHKNYKGVQKQFTQTWRHKTTCPEVKAVYKIVVSEASMTQYQQYLDSVEVAGNYVAMGKSRGNENRRWHGTKRKCRLGDSGNETFCADAECALCNIIRTSFDLKFFKAATGWGRFGRGIYTSSTSSKSNDYSKNLGVSSDWKALLLNKVVVGNGKKLTQDDTTLTEPPPGYNSVLAEVVPGGALNYDELVVYNNEAVRPSYLVMYKSP
ncbi:hypothetical protein BJ322DRAFT_1104161 [Thelephora terrestris]|uniref:PARP catalytic domain-containing protein n=1 Tax=Thelephora terrestris TaxID=56493 RepID=A0A9P6HMH3_9AGAM|nr:hypothetical protein BJ322DRAFT_1104161 [Thelephora terrestris]